MSWSRSLPSRLLSNAANGFRCLQITARSLWKGGSYPDIGAEHEWDVAGGIALLLVTRGHVLTSECIPPSFNNRNPLFPGLVGFSAAGIERLHPFLDPVSTGTGFRGLSSLDSSPCGSQFEFVKNHIHRRFGKRTTHERAIFCTFTWAASNSRPLLGCLSADF